MTLPISMQVIGWQNSFFILSVPFLTGPFLYLYIRSFKETITWRKALPHFITFFIFLILTYWNVSVLNRIYPGSKQVPPEVLNRPTTLFITYAKPIQQIIYFFLTRRALLSYQRSIRHLFSETSRIDLQWAKFLVNGYLVLVLSFIVIFPLILRYPEYVSSLLLLNMVIATPYIYGATYKGILQPSIWQTQPGVNKELIEEEIHQAEEIETTKTDPEKPRSTKTGLSESRIEYLVKGIYALMEQEKIYQETELTLQQLAGKLQVPTYQVSQTLREGMKKNFYDLVNSYRVEEAKRLLLDPGNNNYTILSVGFEAGFNSKTTFNTVFKKFTGLTPTEFRDKEKIITVPV
ncbi:MAG TPA: helix-turn-helix domain-containing protein [Chitinophagaceae bacterium]